ncbi:hypothetical protein GALMADRAFT_118227 [Galerina marginata CBS 339.88]|uniref:PH domain-containing protein n=1 Tax=Galerina marginata (strain CBS 339.88) TaxID=685588 RepID=A0A067TIG4_GALM3|nr:hypothetical protein GALMADRAFT_118227 [Galerina marginata CBS 339.88]
MSALLNKAGKRLFAKHLEQYTPADPLYEVYTNEKGKQKRRKRALPPGLSKRDAQILRTLMGRAHHLDRGFSILGMRFGYTFLIGLIPLAGDFTDIGLNYLLILRPAQKLDLPGWLVRHMLMNNAISAGVGFVPIVGDVFVGSFKANSRNVALLEEFLRIRGEEAIKMGGVQDVTEGKRLGWFGKAKAKNNAAQAALSQNDVEQVKPGAGMTGAELQNTLADAPSTQKRGFFGSRSRKSKAPPLGTIPPASAN